MKSRQQIATVHTDEAGQPHGHYSQAVTHAGVVYVSGILGNASPEGSAGRSVAEQAEHCLAQMSSILHAANSSLECLLKLSVYVEGLDNWPQVNEVCARMLGAHRPARIVVPATRMRFDSSIEMDAIAAVKSD